jgi:hypothetical protein
LDFSKSWDFFLDFLGGIFGVFSFGIFWDFPRILWEFFGISIRILLEFFLNSFETLLEMNRIIEYKRSLYFCQDFGLMEKKEGRRKI